MKWNELAQFSEHLAKMLDDGIMPERAFEIATRGMSASSNRKFADELRRALLEGENLNISASQYKIPPFYAAMLQCGHLTGRMPQALRAAGQFISNLLPIKACLHRCFAFIIASYTLTLLLSWLILNQSPLPALGAMAIIFLPPLLFKSTRYFYDAMLSMIPFVGTWHRQLALMEFFQPLAIAYNSTLSVEDMFDHSLSAIGNRYLRRRMAKSLTMIQNRQSITAALESVELIPAGVTHLLDVGELSGKLQSSLERIAAELKKLVEAKLELIKGLATAACLTLGIFYPLLIILPIFIHNNSLITLAIGAMMGYSTIMPIYAAVKNYWDKAAEINMWWGQVQRTRPAKDNI